MRSVPAYQGVSNMIALDRDGELMGQVTLYTKIDSIDETVKVGLVDVNGDLPKHRLDSN